MLGRYLITLDTSAIPSFNKQITNKKKQFNSIVNYYFSLIN